MVFLAWKSPSLHTICNLTSLLSGSSTVADWDFSETKTPSTPASRLVKLQIVWSIAKVLVSIVQCLIRRMQKLVLAVMSYM